jgi:hypothetical protein
MPANRSTALAGSASFFADGEAAIAEAANEITAAKHKAFFHESRVINDISTKRRTLFLYCQPWPGGMQLTGPTRHLKRIIAAKAKTKLETEN